MKTLGPTPAAVSQEATCHGSPFLRGGRGSGDRTKQRILTRSTAPTHCDTEPNQPDVGNVASQGCQSRSSTWTPPTWPLAKCLFALFASAGICPCRGNRHPEVRAVPANPNDSSLSLTCRCRVGGWAMHGLVTSEAAKPPSPAAMKSTTRADVGGVVSFLFQHGSQKARCFVGPICRVDTSPCPHEHRS